MAAAVCSFESLEGAINTVIQTIQLGVPIARIELNRPDKLNALTLPILQDLADTAHDLRKDKSLRAVVLAVGGDHPPALQEQLSAVAHGVSPLQKNVVARIFPDARPRCE